MPATRLEANGEEEGEGCPAEDIARWRETGDVLLHGTPPRRIAAVRTSIQPFLRSLRWLRTHTTTLNEQRHISFM